MAQKGQTIGNCLNLGYKLKCPFQAHESLTGDNFFMLCNIPQIVLETCFQGLFVEADFQFLFCFGVIFGRFSLSMCQQFQIPLRHNFGRKNYKSFCSGLVMSNNGIVMSNIQVGFL